MKHTKFPLRACAAAAALMLTSAAYADFSTDGYFRAGTGAGTKDNSNACFALAGAGLKYRLGNECDTFAEISLKNTMKVNGIQITGAIMPQLSSPKQDPTGTSVTLSQVYVEGKGFDILPEANFWVGKRYLGRSDIHILDTRYTELDGTGGGVDNIDVGAGKLGVAYFRRDSVAPGDWVGWGTASRLNVDFSTSKVNAGGWLRILLGLVNSEAPGGQKGRSLSIQHAQWNPFGLGGSNTVWLQFAQGSSNLNGSFGNGLNNPNGKDNWVPTDLSGSTWVQNNDERHMAHRLADEFSWQVGRFSGVVVGHLQEDYDAGYKTTSNSMGTRVAYAFTNNFKLLGEIGRSNRKPTGGSTETLTKYTIAPTLSLGKGWKDRPELRLYYTHATWNDAAAADSNNTLLAGKRSGNRFGVQVETWW